MFGQDTSDRPAGNEDVGTAKPGAIGMKILVAEDDQVLRKMLEVVFARKTVPCQLVGDGQEAVAAWENGAFDLVLMDIQMPRLDGLAATRIIREREEQQGGHVPIIAMTAHATTENRDLYRQAGMDDYIAKPFRVEQFLLLLDKYVTHH